MPTKMVSSALINDDLDFAQAMWLLDAEKFLNDYHTKLTGVVACQGCGREFPELDPEIHEVHSCEDCQ